MYSFHRYVFHMGLLSINDASSNIKDFLNQLVALLVRALLSDLCCVGLYRFESCRTHYFLSVPLILIQYEFTLKCVLLVPHTGQLSMESARRREKRLVVLN